MVTYFGTTRRVLGALVLAGCLFLSLANPGRAAGQAAPGPVPLTSQIPAQAPAWCHQLPRPEYKTLERVPVQSDWFEVYRIRPGVFALYEPLQQEEVISYLIAGEQRALLFDTGMGIGDIHAVVLQLTALPVTVLNSHTHSDHVGGNADFKEILTRATPFTRRNALGYPDARKEVFAPGALCSTLPPAVDPAKWRVRSFNSSRYVKENETLDLGGRTLTVLFTPGHTPDSLCLFDEANGLLFTGDTFYPGPIYLFGDETSLPDYFASVERLAALAPKLKLLLPGHNVPVAGPEYLTRLQKAMEALKAGTVKPQNAGGLLAAPPSRGGALYIFEGFSLLLARPYSAP
jgi:glyoxylase-like metal-dependent hydrolase (beta-lactamase superfamily II)